MVRNRKNVFITEADLTLHAHELVDKLLDLVRLLAGHANVFDQCLDAHGQLLVHAAFPQEPNHPLPVCVGEVARFLCRPCQLLSLTILVPFLP